MIETKRTILRPIRPEDNEQVFTYRSDSETNRFQSWIPNNLEDVNNFIAGNPSKFNIPESWFQLVVLDKESDEIIGDIGVHFIDDDNLQSGIGYTLSKKNQGRGFATEAVTAVVDYLFHRLEKHRIVASVDPENAGSISLVERLGFRKEAHFRESVLMNGKWVDDVIYAILKREWK